MVLVSEGIKIVWWSLPNLRKENMSNDCISATSCEIPVSETQTHIYISFYKLQAIFLNHKLKGRKEKCTKLMHVFVNIALNSEISEKNYAFKS